MYHQMNISINKKTWSSQAKFTEQLDGLMQEKRNSSALAMELRLSDINLSNCRLKLGF